MTTRQRQPPNYKNGCIYKLCCKNPNINEIYVGSTVAFRIRKNRHKTSCNNEKSRNYNFYVYKFIRENGGFENWDMIQIESYEAKDKRDLETRERYYIEMLKSSLNTNIPTQTKKEYYEVKKEDILQKAKEYREKNKLDILQKAKEYYEVNKEDLKQKAKEYHEKNKEIIKKKAKEYYEVKKEDLKQKVKEYREKNKLDIKQKAKEYYEVKKEDILQKKKIYREKNKEIIKNKMSQKVNCPNCGKELSKCSLYRHIKRKH